MEHQHDGECIEQDVEDFTDAEGGEAYTFYVCSVTGESHRTVKGFELHDD